MVAFKEIFSVAIVNPDHSKRPCIDDVLGFYAARPTSFSSSLLRPFEAPPVTQEFSFITQEENHGVRNKIMKGLRASTSPADARADSAAVNP